MSDDKLVVIQPGALAVPDMTTGGLGLDSDLFQNLRPAFLEIVQKSTKQDNVQIGKFRDTSTNQHFDEMRWVLLGKPQKQREWFKEKNDWSKENKHCFSLDSIEPHPKAKHPPAMSCDVCPKGDINWKKWQQTQQPSDLPPCKMFYRLFLADRATQLPYIYNVKGTAIKPFERDLRDQLGKAAKIQALTVQAENRQRAAKGEPLKPLPNLFDFSFTVFPYQAEKGGPFILGIKDVKQLSEEAKQEFGILYMQYTQSRVAQQVHEIEQEAAAVESVVDTVASPADEVKEVEAVVGNAVKTREGKEITI